jgi:hypothetical protein
MLLKTALAEDALRRIKEIGKAGILVGIPSYNNAATIGHVVSMAAEGMTKHFPHLKPVLFNSDGGSSDGTRRAVLETAVPPNVEVIVAEYLGLPGKGSAFRAIFEAARELQVAACVVVDSDLRSITPEWIKLLAGPTIRDGYDYVTPYYTRHKYDGTITNSICYPMTRMLYGLEVRQPIGGDFGFSGRLVDAYLENGDWESDIARYGIDIWMTTTAINESGRVCQARLGAKVHDAKDPAAALGPMFVQVVGTLFRLMTTYQERWKTVTSHERAPICGPEIEVELEPVPVSIPAMIAKLHAGADEYWPLWRLVLSSESRNALEAILARLESDYRFAASDWARMVLDFAVAHNRRGSCRNLTSSPDAIISALTPLYYGRTAGLARESWDMDPDTFEEQLIGQQAREFEKLKAYLIERWRE